MKHRRIVGRRAAVAGTGVAALVVAGFTFQSASASEATPTAAPHTLSVAKAEKLASHLTGDLGADSSAGTYYDAKAKHLVVNVVSEKAADTVEKAGAKARVVENSTAELKEARGAVAKRTTKIPGTSWAIDPTSNKVVVTADRTVGAAELGQLTKAVDKLGAKAELKRSAGEFKPLIAGGDAIEGSGGRCSLGFNVVKGGEPYFITAGHCTEAIDDWTDSSGNALGSNAGSEFPGNDYGLVKYSSDTDHPSEVNLYDGSAQEITGAGDATVGMKVTRSGSTTQVHDGEVTALDATVNYGADGIVEGLIETTVCAEPGDSGGSLFAGSSAIGLTSGGSGDCTSGGETFFQPVPEALDAFGAEIG
ncbi:S1 family peptidase [Streptomyces tsukubensis]|uniref:Serine protease n=1 Tax=Streptomyces tsukubensis TaxID=83656 RepID=A0A1V4AFI8_9ACTN|nr:S1 family peptidase [Streptomyces tsukubensis]OON82354.1 serine protease [Streptomyces tsukubensis]QFR92849.1 trypsin-like serine protease [Streptomyces tsukubensis]